MGTATRDNTCTFKTKLSTFFFTVLICFKKPSNQTTNHIGNFRKIKKWNWSCKNTAFTMLWISKKTLKGTLKQIRKSPYMFVFILKQYPENFALRILKLFAVKFVNLFKNRLIFNTFYCFWMFVNKLFTYLMCTYLKK